MPLPLGPFFSAEKQIGQPAPMGRGRRFHAMTKCWSICSLSTSFAWGGPMHQWQSNQSLVMSQNEPWHKVGRSLPLGRLFRPNLRHIHNSGAQSDAIDSYWSHICECTMHTRRSDIWSEWLRFVGRDYTLVRDCRSWSILPGLINRKWQGKHFHFTSRAAHHWSDFAFLSVRIKGHNRSLSGRALTTLTKR